MEGYSKWLELGQHCLHSGKHPLPGHRGHFPPELKSPGREADRSHPSNAGFSDASTFVCMLTMGISIDGQYPHISVTSIINTSH
jgi:hypothetical protein